MRLAAVFLGLAPIASAPLAPARTEAEVWALVHKVGTADAYQVYLDRFPAGEHHDEALVAFYRVRGLSEVHASPSPPPIVPAPFPSPEPCATLLTNHSLGNVVSDEAKAFLEARGSNRPTDLQAYIRQFPAGACRLNAEAIVTARQKRAQGLRTVAGLGPLAAHRLPAQFMTADDYPASALRSGATGRVVAEWEVAEDGAVEGCRVIQSSGSTALDNATCRLATSRLRYDPARDAGGRPIRSADSQRVDWVLPPD